jgi:hypothetical protein
MIAELHVLGELSFLALLHYMILLPLFNQVLSRHVHLLFKIFPSHELFVPYLNGLSLGLFHLPVEYSLLLGVRKLHAQLLVLRLIQLGESVIALSHLPIHDILHLLLLVKHLAVALLYFSFLLLR